jgi:hypothetical protein
MKRLIWALICLIMTVSAAEAGDLYRVIVAGDADAAHLQSTGVRAVLKTDDGYLVLTDD